LAWVLDSIFFWVDDPRKWPTSVEITLRGARGLTVGFDSRERALAFADALRS